MLQQMLRNPEMRRMMFSPEMMRMQLQMQRQMDGGRGGNSAMAAPGTTDNTPQTDSTTTRDTANATPNQQTNADAANPFAAFGGAGAGTNANPFASLFGGGANPFAPQAQGQSNTSNTGTDSTQGNQNASSAPPNPFPNLFGGAEGGQPNPIADAARNIMQNPQAMQQMMQMMGGGSGAGANPFAAFGQNPAAGAGAGDAGSQQANPFASLFGPGFGGGGFGGPPPPADNRPPEEVYESQLRQLNEMGFYEFDRNVSALRRSGGNVQGAIEFLLNGTS